MKSPRVLLICCVCVGVYVLLDAAPVHAAVESAGLLDRATRHFEDSLTKWGDATTTAALALFWMLAAIAFCWECGTLALRGGSMEDALAFLMRFVFIEGLWLYILLNAVPIGTAIIDSLRQLGSTASGLPRDLMPSAILDVGFSLLWKTVVFVAKNTLTAPIVSACALIMALVILVVFALTAINMLILIVSQWFLLYGGIFFLGFGGAPWGSEPARNYLFLALSIGGQLFGMAGVVGLGQSFIEKQYAELSGDTSFGELAVILVVAVLVYLLSNQIPKLFARFVPGGYASQGIGAAGLLGATTSLAAALGATAAMAKGAAASVAGFAKATNAAYSAAKLQSQSPPSQRSQTGVSTGNGGSIGPSGGAHTSTQTQGPLAAMLSSSGFASSRNGGGATNASSSSRGGTHTTPTDKAADPSKPTANQSAPLSSDENSAAARTEAQKMPSGAADTNGTAPAASSSRPTSGSPHASAQAREQSRNHGGENDGEPAAGTSDASEAHSGSGSGSGSDSGSADRSAAEAGETGEDAPKPTQNAATGSEPSSSTSEDDGAVASSSERGATAAANEPEAAANEAASTARTGETASSSASAPHSTTARSEENSPASSSMDTGAAHAAGQAHPAGAADASASSGPTSSSGTGAVTDTIAPQQSAETTAGNERDAATDSTAAKSEASHAAPSPSADVQSSANPTESGSVGAAAPTPASSETAQPGSQRGASAIGTIAATAKILGAQAVQHQRNRLTQAKEAFMARADKTTGGQIAQAIRKKYGIEDASPTETESRPLRSHTGSSEHAESRASVGPKHPADWSTGTDPMTDRQWEFLQRQLGDEVDPHMTKAEAAILIDELLNDEE